MLKKIMHFPHNPHVSQTLIDIDIILLYLDRGQNNFNVGFRYILSPKIPLATTIHKRWFPLLQTLFPPL
jgi:hypothetical protein